MPTGATDRQLVLRFVLEAPSNKDCGDVPAKRGPAAETKGAKFSFQSTLSYKTVSALSRAMKKRCQNARSCSLFQTRTEINQHSS